ncbi:MAG: cobalt-precorrin-5B (C(1))-methyltransferase [Deltaproteobacteria bacterium]|nr:cobalt-precorrin-5B (C(1))-methyltransferase [Deltaproteobacteria bacterium]
MKQTNLEGNAKKGLRKGYTTGACAAAGAKAAAQALFASIEGGNTPPKGGLLLPPTYVSLFLPAGFAARIPVASVAVAGKKARAIVIKDAGDDPDVTDKAEIAVEVELLNRTGRNSIMVKGGAGVGVVTKPGLKVKPGLHAINPVPMKMIRGAVLGVLKGHGIKARVSVIVSVPKGAELAKKTMNQRLGIIGGISILGTTGIVEPMSTLAYTHSISCAVDVALANGADTIVFSTGRSSERVAEGYLSLPQESFVLTGDHMGYALKDAGKKRGVKRVVVCGQFGKMSKLGAGHFETHCSDSEVELGFLAGICKKSGATDEIIRKVKTANTAREVYFILKEKGMDAVFKKICRRVKDNARRFVRKGVEVRALLAGYEGKVVYWC